jgi:hypothetical protein
LAAFPAAGILLGLHSRLSKATDQTSGFAADLTLPTSGNKQTVQISSKGEIRGVNITMVKS